MERLSTITLRGGRRLLTDLKGWLSRRAEEKQRLYKEHGKPLEEAHTGEYLAIGPEGQTILGKKSGEVLRKALDSFGSGNFGLFRVGHRAIARWLRINQ